MQYEYAVPVQVRFTEWHIVVSSGPITAGQAMEEAVEVICDLYGVKEEDCEAQFPRERAVLGPKHKGE